MENRELEISGALERAETMLNNGVVNNEFSEFFAPVSEESLKADMIAVLSYQFKRLRRFESDWANEIAIAYWTAAASLHSDGWKIAGNYLKETMLSL